MRWIPLLAVMGCLGMLDDARAGDESAGEPLNSVPATTSPRLSMVTMVTMVPMVPMVPMAPPRVADGAFLSLAAGVYVSGASDWWTTCQFRQDGIEEANPMIGSLADSPGALAAVKLGGGSLINYIAYNLKKDGKRYWKVPQIAWIALNIAVSAHNSNQHR